MSVSVLISIYEKDKPELFDQAMNSIWTYQNLKPSQIVLIKDGKMSKPLYNVIRFWKQKLGDLLVIHENEINMGLTKSLNQGLKYVTSKYIARMDSDDISLPDRFEKQVAFLEENINIAVVGGAIEEIDESGEKINTRYYPLTPEDVRAYIVKASPVAHPAVMMRKTLFNSGLQYNEQFRTSQDIALWFDILNAGYEISNLKDVVLRFRITKDTYQRRNSSKAINEFNIYMKGIKEMHNITYKYIYPLFRLCFRLMPTIIVEKIYNSKIRNRVLQK